MPPAAKGTQSLWKPFRGVVTVLDMLEPYLS